MEVEAQIGVQPDEMAGVAEDLARLGYSDAGITRLLGEPSWRYVDAATHARLMAELDADPALGAVAGVMLFRRELRPERLREALGAERFAAWRRAGLVEEHEGIVRGRVWLYPFQDLVLVTDPPAPAGAEPDGYVMAVGGATELLAAGMSGRGGRVVDLGTGCGVLALLAAREADEVLGVDLNPRACAYAVLNARLNGIDNVRFEVADLAAVEGRFDHVVAQPPWVVGPDAVTYRDAPGGDDVALGEVVRTAAARLSPGGLAQLVLSWVADPADPVARVRAWSEETGCDGLLLASTPEAPERYARRFLGRSPSREALDRWLEHYRHHGIEALAHGLLNLRERGGGGWFRVLELPDDHGGRDRAIVERMFAAADRLDASDDETLLAGRYRPAPRLGMRVLRRHDGQRWREESGRTELPDGLAFAVDHDVATMRLVESCDGQTAPAERIAAVAAELDAPEPAVAAHFGETLRLLLSYGFVEPA